MKTKTKWNKQLALDHWKSLDENLDIMRHMRAIPYKAKGSKYGACGVRIDGSPEFIDAVLSHLKPMIRGEGINTRLELGRTQVDGSNLGKSFGYSQGEVCYIRLHERGDEGKMLQAYMSATKPKGK